VPHGTWKTITFIAAQDRVTAPFVLKGPMTGKVDGIEEAI
jgi:hypothetical protein